MLYKNSWSKNQNKNSYHIAYSPVNLFKLKYLSIRAVPWVKIMFQYDEQ